MLNVSLHTTEFLVQCVPQLERNSIMFQAIIFVFCFVFFLLRVMMIAKKFLDAGHKLSFAVASRKTFGHELSEFGLDSSVGEAPVVAIRTAKGDKYVMQEEFS